MLLILSRCRKKKRMMKYRKRFWVRKGPFIIYTLGGGDSYVIYKNLVALPPLDDLHVEDPPYKILKNLYTPPPHLYECFNTVNSEHCISQDPELLFPLHTFALQLRSGYSYCSWNI